MNIYKGENLSAALRSCCCLVFFLLPGAVFAAGELAEGGERQPLNWSAISLFLVFVVITLGISYWASQRTRSSSEFYTAGGDITGFQNGLAIAGDYMSAAAFLGVSALMFAGGFDGLIIGIGAVAGWPIMLFLLAERVRNLGKYTFTDVVSMRLEKQGSRLIAVFGTVTVVILYLSAQMVGAGKLIELLFGLPYEIAVVIVSLLVIAYVAFGGMLATTWVQITKAVLLLSGVTIAVVLIMSGVGFELDALLDGAAANHPKGDAILRPGLLFNDPIQVTTILVTMMFGTLGLPHILMRLFTVPTMEDARKSAFYASGFIGYFYIMIVIIGYGTAYYLYQHPEFFGADGQLIGGNNMAAIHLAQALGGDLLMGFMSAVAFATILAVVAGLTVSGAAAISHDLYAEVLCKGNPDPVKELRLTKITTLALGLLAIGMGILFQHQNIAFIATMPLVVAASVNLPVLLLSLYWSGVTTRGAVIGALIGLFSSVGLTVVGPQVWVGVLGNAEPLFPYTYPTLFTMPLAFAATWLFSVMDSAEQRKVSKDKYHSLLYRSEFGEEGA